MRLKSRLKAYTNIARAVTCNAFNRIMPPNVAHFMVTWRCNSKCQRCDIWQRETEPELSLSEWLKVLPQLKSLDVIKLTGGEPSLKEELPQLVKSIQDIIQPYLLQIITNGFLPDKVKSLVEFTGGRNLHIRVSLDGWGKVHNTLRGRPDAFERAMETLNTLIALKQRYPLSLGINYNVVEETLEDIPEVLAWCRKAKINFIPGFPIKPFLRADGEPQRALLIKDKESFKRNFLKIYNSSQGFNSLENWILKNVTKRNFYALLNESENLRFKCLELKNLLYLLPQGNVVTCGVKQKPIGNLLQEPLEKIWFSEKIIPFRREVDNCSGCLQLAIKIISRVYLRGW
jgi:MoaA/NifB/PqqE/SkfB family radical SAM enzyme